MDSSNRSSNPLKRNGFEETRYDVCVSARASAIVGKSLSKLGWASCIPVWEGSRPVSIEPCDDGLFGPGTYAFVKILPCSEASDDNAGMVTGPFEEKGVALNESESMIIQQTSMVTMALRH